MAEPAGTWQPERQLAETIDLTSAEYLEGIVSQKPGGFGFGRDACSFTQLVNENITAKNKIPTRKEVFFFMQFAFENKDRKETAKKKFYFPFFKTVMISLGFFDPKTVFPATRTSAPSLTNSGAFFKSTPPSTSIFAFDFFVRMSCLRYFTF